MKTGEATAVPWSCRCGLLKQAAEDPDIPVRYDAQSNQFCIHYKRGGREGMVALNFCPSCGEAAPVVAQKLELDEELTREMDRLRNLLSDLHSLEEVVTEFGDPDRESFVTIIRGEGSKSFRAAIYSRWSPLLHVYLIDYGEDRRFGVSFTDRAPDAPFMPQEEPLNAREGGTLRQKPS